MDEPFLFTMQRKSIYFFIYLILIFLIVFSIDILITYLQKPLVVDAGDFYFLNSVILKKYYFEADLNCISNEIVIPKNKPWIAVLGESTSAGFPYHFFQAWPGVVQEMINWNLEDEKKYHLVNFSGAALTSYSIRDLSRKIANLNPKMVIIYSGHNEYYGTITSENVTKHYLNLLYLWLYDNSSIFRLFLRIINNLSTSGLLYKKTLMEERFSDQTFSDTNPFKAEIYIENIKKSIDYFLNNNIQVVLIRPVSNLIDQPPFRATNDELYEVWLNERIKPDPDLNILKKIKDLDIVPFRVKEYFLNKLDDLTLEYINNKNFLYIDLEKELLNLYGVKSFSSDLFYEHVHFNRKGQDIVGFIIGNKIISFLNSENFENIKNFFYFTPEFRLQLHKRLKIHPILEANALANIYSLVSHQPFLGMKLKDSYNLNQWKNYIFSQIEKPFLSIISEVPNNYWYIEYIKYLKNMGYIDETLNFYKVLYRVYPASRRVINDYLLFLQNNSIISEDFNSLIKKYQIYYELIKIGIDECVK